MTTWHNDPPTEPGWYWWRYDSNDIAEAVKIHRAVGELRVARMFRLRAETPSEIKGQWSPKIDEPK